MAGGYFLPSHSTRLFRLRVRIVDCFHSELRQTTGPLNRRKGALRAIFVDHAIVFLAFFERLEFVEGAGPV
jgi:hypothetical protein